MRVFAVKDIRKILDFHALALASANDYPVARPLLARVRSQEGRRFTGILGPRGVGKTVLLRQLAAGSPDAVYISLDTLDREVDLFELIKKLSQDYGYGRFYLDEVHFCSGIEGVLKALYDVLDVRVWFTSSMALALQESAYDLSRRIVLRTLFPFSYREYLRFRHKIDLDPLRLDAIYARDWTAAHMRSGLHFDDYLKGGLMPFALDEPEPLEILASIRDTVIRKDVPHVARLHTDELDMLEKLLAFIGRSPIDGVNYTSLSKNLGITKYKAEQYLGLFEKAFIVQRVFPKGTNVLKEPKVLLAPPYRMLYRDYDEALGGLREDFFAEAMRYRGLPFSYLKTKRGAKTPDYVIEEDETGRTVIEIGGKSKRGNQFKDFSADQRFVFSHGDAVDGIYRPLFMLGMA